MYSQQASIAQSLGCRNHTSPLELASTTLLEEAV
jgi:hypothetical protein